MFRTSRQWTDWWKNRKDISWDRAYGSAPEAVYHPHRGLIIEELRKKPFGSIGEVGCGAGANLLLIRKFFPHVQVGGADVNPEAIATAKRLMPGGFFDCKNADDLWFSTDSCDVALSDMTCIYLDRRHIRKALLEMKRIARQRIILVEFHHKSWWKRTALWLATGYSAYDYSRLLEQIGFYNIEGRKLTEQDWPGGQPQKEFAWIFMASV